MNDRKTSPSKSFKSCFIIVMCVINNVVIWLSIIKYTTEQINDLLQI